MNGPILGVRSRCTRIDWRSGFLAFACLLLPIQRASAAALPGQWTLFADTSNGVAIGNYPVLAVSAATHELYSSYQFTGPTSETLGKVWRCDLTAPTHTFALLPQTGFTLPPPGGTNPQMNAFSMTVSISGEPIVGCISPATTNTNTKLYRFDKASQTWIAPTLTSGPGLSIAPQQPNAAMYTLVTAADGTIYGGGQFANVFKSTDGGHTFAVIDDTALLKQTDPNYFPTVANGQNFAGAVYGINVDNASGRVYIGTESAGGLYSPDGGNTWHPVDNDYTNPNGPMHRITNAGNVAGVGITKDGKVVYQGTHGAGATPVDDNVHLWLADPVAHTVVSAQGIPASIIGGQTVSQIVTTASGQMFFHTNSPTVKSDGTPGVGGIYTSSDGLNWAPFNVGINDVAQLPNGTYYDFNGHGAEGSFAVLGDQVFFEDAAGKIYTYTVPEPAALAALVFPSFYGLLRRARRTCPPGWQTR